MLYVLIILLLIAIVLWMMIPVARSKRKREKHQERLAKIERLRPEVSAAFAEIGLFYNYNHYITDSEPALGVQNL